MKRLADAVAPFLARMTGGNDLAVRELRRAVVNDVWVSAVRDVFREAAPFVLAHVNAVYVMSAEKGAAVRRFDRPASSDDAPVSPVSGAVLVVYVDDSMVRSELDNRQELMKMKFCEHGENVSSLKIVPALRDMKKRHPFAHLAETAAGSLRSSRRPARVLEQLDSPGSSPGARSHVGIAAFSGEPPASGSDAAEVAKGVENPAVRAALQRAMVACENREREK